MVLCQVQTICYAVDEGSCWGARVNSMKNTFATCSCALLYATASNIGQDIYSLWYHTCKDATFFEIVNTSFKGQIHLTLKIS